MTPDHAQAHEFVQQGKQADMDVPDDLQVTGDVADVAQEIGEKESMMKDAEILSDAAVTEADEIAMDQADGEEEQERVWLFTLEFILFFCVARGTFVLFAFRTKQKNKNVQRSYARGREGRRRGGG